ncbi:hypothetical protein BGZ76_008316 [Entomortierella beljakovae]|nr:hypothetical protein BGZ76_008316 [Entomortierella beljakovae]
MTRGDIIRKGDDCRDRGDFSKARKYYTQAMKQCPTVARERLETLRSIRTTSDKAEDFKNSWKTFGKNAKKIPLVTTIQSFSNRRPVPTDTPLLFNKPNDTPAVPMTGQSPISPGFTSPQSPPLLSSAPPLGPGPHFPTTKTPNIISPPLSQSTSGSTAASTSTLVADYIEVSKGSDKSDKERLESINNKVLSIIYQFGQMPVNVDTIQELVILSAIPDRIIFVSIVNQLLQQIKDKSILLEELLQGLAVIFSSMPEELDMEGRYGAFLNILGVLADCLKGRHNDNNSIQLHHILLAISSLLNAMVIRKVFSLDRAGVFNPLKIQLNSFCISPDTTVCFLASYAKEALICVDNDETVVMSLFRRAFAGLSLFFNIKKMVSGDIDPSKFKDMLQQARDILEVNLQSAWYQGLLYLDSLIALQEWARFEEFVRNSKFKSDPSFLQGVCLRLEQIASTTTDLEIRNGALIYLYYFRADPREIVRDVAQRVLENLGMPVPTSNSASSANAQIIPRPVTHFIGPVRQIPPVWDPFWHSPGKSTLLEEVLLKKTNESIIGNLPENLQRIEDKISSGFRDVLKGINELKHIPAELSEVREVLRGYYAEKLWIQRISNKEERLDLNKCYINLAIVEAPNQREKVRKDLIAQAATFHRMDSYENVSGTNMKSQIQPEELFQRRVLRAGEEDVPNTILIHGRAGIGKTTLCKKIVHIFLSNQDLWSDRFDIVLWIPLRDLKGRQSWRLENVIERFFVSHQTNKIKLAALTTAVNKCIEEERALFILDGYDEILPDIEVAESTDLKELLEYLLKQKHVILTSRPSSVDIKALPRMDLELETVGFSAKDVRDYITMTLHPSNAMAVNDFVQQTPLIQGLVNIPVQLDVMCSCWDSLFSETLAITPTMTNLYHMMVDKLWRIDEIRDDKKKLGHHRINKLTRAQVEKQMTDRNEFLGYLAFWGMKNKHQLEFTEDELGEKVDELDQFRTNNNAGNNLPIDILSMIKQTSILNTADTEDTMKSEEAEKVETIDPSIDLKRPRSWHFLHLTYQEYFAAKWIAQHFGPEWRNSISFESMSDMKAFVQEHKYNSQYEIVWQMVGGMLEKTALVTFFDMIRDEPRDLLGGRHQLLLAGCLKETKVKMDLNLDPRLSKNLKQKEMELLRHLQGSLEKELMQWLQFEMELQDNHGSYSALAMQSVFPEELLVRSMNDSPGIRIYALKALRHHHYLIPTTLKTLLDAYSGANQEIKILILQVLGAQSRLSALSISMLLNAMQSKDQRIKESAADALRGQATLSKSSMDEVSKVLCDSSSYIRASAAEALSLQEHLDEPVVSILVRSLKDTDSQVRNLAAKALGIQPSYPDEVAFALKEALLDSEVSVQIAAAEALGNQSNLSETIVLALLELVESKDHRIKDSAINALRNQSKLTSSTTSALVRVLNGNNTAKRDVAAELLRKQGQLSRETVYALICTVWSTSSESSIAAAKILSNLPTLPDFTILSTISALNSSDAGFLHAAKENLSTHKLSEDMTTNFIHSSQGSGGSNISVKEQTQTTTETLSWALEYPFKYVSATAIKILSAMTALPSSAVHSVIVTIYEKEIVVKESAIKAMSIWLELPSTAFQAFITDIQEGSIDGVAAAQDIHSVLSEAYYIALTDAIQQEDIILREMAVNGLKSQKKLPDSAIKSLLINPLIHKDPEVMRSAAEVLGHQSSLSENIIDDISKVIDNRPDLRKIIVEILGTKAALPDPGTNILLSALKDRCPNVREAAVNALDSQLYLQDYAVDALAEAMNDCDIAIRLLAIKLVGSQQNLTVDNYISLICLIFDTDEEVVMAAMDVLRLVTTLPESAVMGLLGALQNGGYRLRDSAIELLLLQSRLPESVITTLIYSIQDRNEYIRESAIRILHKQTSLDGEAIEVLLSIMHRGHYASPTPNNHRIAAAAVLAKQDALSEQVLILLYKSLNDPDQLISTYAARALGNQIELPESLSAVITKNLENRNSILRRLAPRIIGNCRNDSQFSVLLSTIALQSDNRAVRNEAMEFLKYHSILPRYTLFILTNMIGIVEYNMKVSIIKVLCQQDELVEGVIMLLYSVLVEEGNPNMWKLAEKALTSQSNLSKSTIADFTNSLKSSDESIACISAKILGRQENLPDSEIMSLIGVLYSSRENVKHAAFESLCIQVTQSESATQILVSSLQSSNSEIMYLAAKILGFHQSLPEYAIEGLVKALNDPSSSSSRIREKCLNSISKQSSLSDFAAQALIHSLEDMDNDIRMAAREGLLDQKMLPESAIQTLVAGLRIDDSCLKKKDPFFMASAAEILKEQSSLPCSAEDTLSRALQDRDDEYRERAVRILCAQTSLSESTIQALSLTLKSDNSVLRNLVIDVLSEQDNLPEETIVALVEASQDDDLSNRMSIVKLLGNHPRYLELTAVVFIRASQDRSRIVRDLAAKALYNASMYGTTSDIMFEEIPQEPYPQQYAPEPLKPSVFRHISTLKEGDREASDHAIVALKDQFPLPPSSCVSLVTLLHEDSCDPEIKCKVMKLLGNQPDLPKAVLQDIAKTLNDESFSVDIKSAGAEVLCKHPMLPNAAIEALTKALEGEDIPIRRLAAKALCNQSSQFSVKPALILALLDADSEVRSLALEAIGTKGILMALFDMSTENIMLIYKNVLFRLSCENPVSLCIEKNSLHIFTERGPEKHDQITADQISKVRHAIESVQESYGITMHRKEEKEE